MMWGTHIGAVGAAGGDEGFVAVDERLGHAVPADHVEQFVEGLGHNGRIFLRPRLGRGLRPQCGVRIPTTAIAIAQRQ